MNILITICRKKLCFPGDLHLTDYIERTSTQISFPGDGRSWVILSGIEQRIKDKIEKVGIPLKDWDINIYRGILTGCNEAFIIDKNKRDELIKKSPNSAEVIRPILRGRDIKRYGYDFAEQYVIATFPSKKYDINDYPAIKEYLLKYGKNKLEQSGKPGARKKTNNKWFETQDAIGYWEDFSKQKIIYPDIMRLPRNKDIINAYPYFYFDRQGYYVEATNFLLTGENLESIFMFLISDIGFYIFSKYYSGPQFNATGFRYKKEYLNNLLVPKLSLDDNKKLISLFRTI
ncbi:type II restriction endonuclease [Treponema primitia]|uniref:type II restriction endonuclease n=1 Tax=Treponema primitia TaxID=88058 RepID=UPI00397E9F52